jgi:hypothetical protein
MGLPRGFALSSGCVGILTAFLCLAFSANAKADAIPYPTPGVVNPVTYMFTAANDGDVVAYFAGSTASFDNDLGLLVNGVAQGGFGLDNHSSPLGLSYDFGHVNAGDALVFVLRNKSGLIPPNQLVYSDPSLNGPYDSQTGPAIPGENHVYSTPYTGTGPIIDAIPAGIFVSFEDLPAQGFNSDHNYNDEDFVFTNVAESPVPEPIEIISMLGVTAMGLIGIVIHRRGKAA